MKSNSGKYLIAGLLIALTSVGVRAQGTDAVQPAPGEASGPASTRAADRALEKEVVRALSKTKGLRVSTIGVRARNGVVTLEGMVPEQSQAELAARVAAGVPGVTQVKNALTLSAI